MDRRGHIKGVWLIAATLSLFVIVPALVWTILKVTAPIGDTSPLVWSQRATWPEAPVVERSIKSNPMRQMRAGQDWQKIEFEIAPEVELAVKQAAELARDGVEALRSQEALTRLTELERQLNGHFYTRWLIARHFQLTGDIDSADRWFTDSFKLADAAIVVGYVDEQGNDIANQPTPSLAFGLDRIENDRRDASLVLIYPAPVSSDVGDVYLPIYRTVYRETRPNLPEGVVPDGEYWFAFPGRVGRMIDRELTLRGASTQADAR